MIAWHLVAVREGVGGGNYRSARVWHLRGTRPLHPRGRRVWHLRGTRSRMIVKRPAPHPRAAVRAHVRA